MGVNWRPKDVKKYLWRHSFGPAAPKDQNLPFGGGFQVRKVPHYTPRPSTTPSCGPKTEIGRKPTSQTHPSTI